MRVSTVIGGENNPAAPAVITIAVPERLSGPAAISNARMIENSVPVTTSRARGPRRSTIRPRIGAVIAVAIQNAPTAAPATANDSVRARTCRSIDNDSVPMGIRVMSAIDIILATSGNRQKSR